MSPVSHSLPGLALSWIAAALIAAAGLAPAAARESGSPLGLSERIAAAEALWLSGSHERAEEAYRDVLAAIRHQSAEDLPAWMPEADLALRRIAELMGRDASARRLQDLLAEWSRPGDGVDPLVAALAVYHAGWASLQAEGDVEKAREVWKPLGFLESWRVIGAFENERGGGFHTAYGPEKELDLDAAYDGKKRQVAWRRLPRRPVAGDVDLDALFLPRDECLAYALTFVRSGADRRAALRFGTGDGYKVWVNGRLAGAEDIHRLRSFDQTAVAVDLRAGWNSILFKVAESDGPWGFLARLSDLDGGPLEGVEEGEPDAEALAGLGESYPLEGAPADTGSGAEPGCSTGVETALRRRIAEQPGDARAQYLLGSLLLEKKAHDTAVHPDTEALRRAAEIDDRPAAVHFQLARSHQREGAVQADRDDNAWRVAMQAASDRGSALAALALAGHYLSAFDNRIRARRHLGVALAANPDLEDALLLRGDIEARERFPRARERALETALAASPDSPALLLRRAGELSADGDLEGAESLVWGVLRRNHTLAAARWRLGDILLRRGAAEEAVLWIREDAQLRPFDTGPLRRLATIHLGRDEPARAVEALEEALEICPEDHEIHELRGNALLEQLSRDEAIAAWERALELQPNLPDLRERLEFERAAEGGFEDEFRIDAAPRIAAALKEAGEIDSDDPARVLLELTAIEVNRDGTTREFSQTVIQILNDRGVEMFNRFGVPYAGSEQVVEFKKARVTRPDGTVVDAKLSRHGGAGQSSGQGQASVDLPPLSPGDVFEVEFVREDIAQSFFGDYFGHREIFQGRLAIAEKVLRLRLPRERRFHFHQKNLDIEPVKEDDPDSAHVTYSWTVRDVARIDEEPGMPSPVEFAPQVEVSTFESWDAFATWYHNLIRKQFESSPEIASKVRELISGTTTELEKIRAVYNFIVTEIRYNAWEFGVHGFKPYNAAAVFARRFGDCKDKATLMTVMLAEAGITARPVLIRATTERSEEDLRLPMVRHFNHCISYLPPSGGRTAMFLDGTAALHRLEELPAMDRGARVLVVRPSGSTLEQIPWNEPRDLSSSEEWMVEVAPDRSARVKVRIEAQGDFAVAIRRSFEVAGERRTNLERIYGRRYAGVAVRSESFSDLSDLEAPVSVSFDLEIPRFVEESSEGPSLSLPEDFFRSARSLAALGSLETRQFDVLLSNPREERMRVDFRLPAGYRVKSTPPERDLEDRFGRFRLSLEAGEGRLLSERIIEITSPRVLRADYPQFRAFAASIERLRSEKIVLETSGP